MLIVSAKKLFYFLVREYKFSVKEEGTDSVIYRSENIIFSIFYDSQRSFEIDVVLGKINSCEPFYSFEEIVRAQQVPSDKWLVGYCARNTAEVESRLELIANIMHTYATDLLLGDRNAWGNLERQREADCIKYASSQNLMYSKNKGWHW